MHSALSHLWVSLTLLSSSISVHGCFLQKSSNSSVYRIPISFQPCFDILNFMPVTLYEVLKRLGDHDGHWLIEDLFQKPEVVNLLRPYLWLVDLLTLPSH